MKKFLFVMRSGDSFGNAIMEIRGDKPTEDEIKTVTHEFNTIRIPQYAVVDFKEIAND